MRRKRRPELESTNAVEELPAWARSGATTGKLPLCCQYPVRTFLKFPLVTWIDWQYFQDIWNWIQLTCFVMQFYCVVLHIAERQRLCDKDVLSCDLQVECYVRCPMHMLLFCSLSGLALYLTDLALVSVLFILLQLALKIGALASILAYLNPGHAFL